MSRVLPFRLSTHVTTLILSSVLLLLSASCTKKSENSAAPKSSGKEVNLAIWANYLSPEMQARFTQETGIQIRVSNYSSNEELIAKVQAGAGGIDVAVPSDYMVEIMAKQNLLQPIDSGKIPNKSGVDGAVLKQGFDPENKFSLPYSWNMAGIAVNRELFPGKIKSWKDLFTDKELAGKVSLLDDVRETTGAALKMHGFSVNSTNPEELEKAKATLKDMRSRVKMFRSDTIDALVNKEVAVAHSYSTDAMQASQKSGGKIDFILPEEGGTRSIDNLVILKGSKNSEAAHALINFLLSKDANVSFVQTVMGGPVVKATRDGLTKELKSNTALFPPTSALAKFERLHDVGEATRQYDYLWTEVKTE